MFPQKVKIYLIFIQKVNIDLICTQKVNIDFIFTQKGEYGLYIHFFRFFPQCDTQTAERLLSDSLRCVGKANRHRHHRHTFNPTDPH